MKKIEQSHPHALLDLAIYSSVIVFILTSCSPTEAQSIPLSPEPTLTQNPKPMLVVTATPYHIEKEVTLEKQLDVEPTESDFVFAYEETMHRQLDPNEYHVPFSQNLSDYFGNNDVRYNFCGPSSLSVINSYFELLTNHQNSKMSISEVVNKYFDNDNIPLSFYGRNGATSPYFLYKVAEQMGHDNNLWDIQSIYGRTDYVDLPPIAKSQFPEIVQQAQENVFAKNGILLAQGSINSGWTGLDNEGPKQHYGNSPDFFHFFVITGMNYDSNGKVTMQVIDTLGADGNGFVGTVQLDAYTFPSEHDPKIYSGLYNLYGLVPRP